MDCQQPSPGRNDLKDLIPLGSRVLEIGQMDRPLHPTAKNLDVFTRDELVDKIILHQPERAPNLCEVDYVIRDGSWLGIPDKFDVLLSSHNIEHMPCLVSFFRNADHVLNPRGRIIAFIPDFRYCMDTDKFPSTILDVLEAHHERRIRPSFKNILEKFTMRNPSNIARDHWAKGPHVITGDRYHEIDPVKLEKLLEMDFGQYLDCHCWKFTLRSFRYIADTLHSLGLSKFKVVTVCETQQNRLEFFTILEKVGDVEISCDIAQASSLG